MHIYDILSKLPLFQGMSSEELHEVVTKLKFSFLTLRNRQCLVDKGHNSRGLLFLIDGELEKLSVSSDGTYTVTEHVTAPYLIEPDKLFGFRQRYSHRYTAVKRSHAIFVKKDDVHFLVNQYVVFRLNIFNMLSTRVQRYVDDTWEAAPADIDSRVLLFLSRHTSEDNPETVFRITMCQLAQEIGSSRLEVSRALSRLQEQGRVRLQRGIIRYMKGVH